MCLSGRPGRQGDVSRKPPLRAAAAKKVKYTRGLSVASVSLTAEGLIGIKVRF